MFKRHAEGTNSESPAKKGAPSTAAGEKQEPIPRNIRPQSIQLNFVCKTWEEIAPGNLYYLPLCQNPKYMFDQASTNQFNKFREMWHTMEIHTPKVRLSNLIMLQDDLRVQNNTPTDATAFTQVVYLMKYCPKGQKQYFKLIDCPNANDMTETKSLTYDLAPQIPAGETTKAQLVQIKGFKDFESLGILGAKANYTAGFVPYSAVKIDDGHVLQDPYVAPNTTSVQFQHISGNMYPADNNANFIAPTYCMTYARNQDSLSFHKYGDSMELPINTNIEGMQLMNTPGNNFLADQKVVIEDASKKTYTYETEFAWPSRNRPFLSRGNYFDTNTDPITSGKTEGTLNHYFFCMPPIRKPNGSLLGQRCSLYMEQEISVTFHANQATFFPDEADDAMQVNQDNQIILRRNIYPTPTITDTGRSFFCKPKEESECQLYAPQPWIKRAPPCFTDSSRGMADSIIYYKQQLELAPFITMSQSNPLPPGAYDFSGGTPATKFFRLEWLSDPTYAGREYDALPFWEAARDNNGMFSIWWGSKKPISHNKKFTYIAALNEGGNLSVIYENATDTNNVLTIDVNKWLERFKAVTKQTCKAQFKTPDVKRAEAGSREALVFFV
nr:MAG: major capsid protein [Army ant associated bidensovirus 2]